MAVTDTPRQSDTTAPWRPWPAPTTDAPVDVWHRRGYRVPDVRWTIGVKKHGGRVIDGWVEPDGTVTDGSGYTHWMLPPEGPSP